MRTISTSFPSPISILLTALTMAGVASAQVALPVFLTPTQLPAPVNMVGTNSYSMALSADGLRAMVETDRPGGRGGRDLFLLQRPTTQSGFTSYGPMGFCGPSDEGGGSLWDERDLLIFSSNRPGGQGGFDLYTASGSSLTIIGSPTGLNSPWDDAEPSITSDGLEFFFTSNRPGSLGGKSIWRSMRASAQHDWGIPVALTSIDSANHEQSPSLTDDGLWLFFASNRSGNFDIYAAARSTRQAPFGAPVRVAELSGPNHDIGIKIAPQDAQALVTVMINGRAVIMSAARNGNRAMSLPGTALSASDTVAPGEILSVHLRAPIGHYGVVMLGSPIAPVQIGIGELSVNPAALMVIDVGVQADQVRLVQMLLPENPHLRGVSIALQALSGPASQLRLTNAVVLTVQ